MQQPLSTPTHFGHSHARRALVEAVDAFARTAEALTDHDLLTASRCHGWAVLDVVVHVRTGLLEMLGGVTALTGEPADQDAATYWHDYPGDEDPAASILWTRRTSSAYQRPTGAVEHLRMAADAVVGAVRRMDDCTVAFQGHVLASGDFLATWAVELAVHQLDVGLVLDVVEPPPASMDIAAQTLEALLQTRRPAGCSETRWVLLGSGRLAASTEDRHVLGPAADLLPVLG